MPEIDILRDLAVVMLIAGAVILVFHWLKQPVVLGYIIAGLIIGPHTPPFPLVRNIAVINVLADLGIILLMYSVGLEFSLRRLTRMGKVALIGGALNMALVFTLAYQIGLGLGWGTTNAIFLAAALSVSSTALIAKALQDQRRSQEPASQAVLGITIFEDFVGIGLIAVLAGLGTGGGAQLEAIGPVLLKLTLFGALVLLLGVAVVPRLMNYVIATGNRELAVVIGLAICFGMALFSRWLGLSVAAGAFIAGALVAESRRSETVSRLMRPIKDAFAALFFVTIGMLIVPAFLLQYWWQILLLSAALIAGKILAVAIATFLVGHNHRDALRVGMSLTLLGEFSIIIVKVGQETQATDPFLYPVVVGIAAVTTLVSPYIINASFSAGEWVDGRLPTWLLRYLRAAETVLQRFRFQVGANDAAGAELRRNVTGILINLGLLALLVTLARFGYARLEPLNRLTDLPATALALVMGAALFILAAFPLIALVRYAQTLAANAAADMDEPGAFGLFLTRPGFRAILRDFIAILVILPLGALMGALLPRLPQAPYIPFVGIGIAALLALYFVWDSAKAWHNMVEDVARQYLLGEGEEPDAEPAAPDHPDRRNSD